jgi:hypothetical protein
MIYQDRVGTSAQRKLSWKPICGVSAPVSTERGLPAGFKFTKDMLTAHFCHSDLPRVGTVALPDVAAATDVGTPDILNEIYHITLCAQMSQLWSIPTDCPQREKRCVHSVRPQLPDCIPPPPPATTAVYTSVLLLKHIKCSVAPSTRRSR